MISSASREIWHIAMWGGQQDLRMTLAHLPPTLSGERKAIEVIRHQLRAVSWDSDFAADDASTVSCAIGNYSETSASANNLLAQDIPPEAYLAMT
jgi:hypothetical protein